MAKKLAISINGGGMLGSKQNLLINEVFDVNNSSFSKMEEILNNPNPYNEEYTESHHIIPRFFYKMNRLDVDNSAENLIQISLKNHFLVHYYGAKCAKSEYKSRMWLSVIRTLGNFKKNGWENELDSIAEKIKYAKIKANESRSKMMTSEAKRYLSEINSGERHPQYGKPKSDKTKKLISIAEKGKIIPDEVRIRISNKLKGNVQHTEREKELSRKASIAFIAPAKVAYWSYKSAGGELGWNQFQRKFSRGELK